MTSLGYISDHTMNFQIIVNPLTDSSTVIDWCYATASLWTQESLLIEGAICRKIGASATLQACIALRDRILATWQEDRKDSLDPQDRRLLELHHLLLCYCSPPWNTSSAVGKCPSHIVRMNCAHPSPIGRGRSTSTCDSSWSFYRAKSLVWSPSWLNALDCRAFGRASYPGTAHK